MSDRSGGGGGFGAFLFGIVLGAVAGFVFAPTEGGESTRRKVTKGLRNLKDLAEDEDEEEPEMTTREELRRRLEAARRRRARATRPPVPPASDEEDEPLA